jgi:hypothetical protein
MALNGSIRTTLCGFSYIVTLIVNVRSPPMAALKEKNMVTFILFEAIRIVSINPQPPKIVCVFTDIN